MKITIGQLKRLINEARMATRDELAADIAAMGPRDTAEDDYADMDTGEVYLAAGAEARTSRFHPQYVKPAKKQMSNPFGNSTGAISPDPEEDSWELYHNAIEEFADGLEGLGHDPAEASDAAESFFSHYTQWKRWAADLGLTREEMKATVVDTIADAMSR